MRQTYADTSPDTLMLRFVEGLAGYSAMQTAGRPSKRLRRKTPAANALGEPAGKNTACDRHTPLRGSRLKGACFKGCSPGRILGVLPWWAGGTSAPLMLGKSIDPRREIDPIRRKAKPFG